MEQYWDQIKQIVHESDIVLEILDARAVDLSRNEQLEKIIANAARPRIYVLNKCDLVAKKELEFNQQLKVVREDVQKDLEEKYRADIISSQALVKRLEGEQQKAAGL